MRLSAMSMIGTTISNSMQIPCKTMNVAIIGGGITGACAASVLTSANMGENGNCNLSEVPKGIMEPITKTNRCWRSENGEGHRTQIKIDLFDQGRSGVGGRSSHRRRKVDEKEMRWDHGCQFFRADTEKFKTVVSSWISHGIASEWKGTFTSDTTDFNDSSSNQPIISNDFFGLPSHPPFYVGVDGMQSVPNRLLESLLSSSNVNCADENIHIFTGTRVSQIRQNKSTKKWYLFGTSGQAAYHDTPECKVQGTPGVNDEMKERALGHDSALKNGYDAIILTDVSSSFGTWHRASAGVPENFASRVRDRVGARVPLFTAMIAFNAPSDPSLEHQTKEQPIFPFDAASFSKSDVLWFASRTNSKPMSDMERECWTLVSTPEYAMRQIKETPMQDAKTGEFVPQNKEYLTTIPGPDLEAAFREQLTSKDGILGEKHALNPADIPKTVFLDAQRWGSAMPCHRYLDENSVTREIISGVPYDSGRGALAPTVRENCKEEDNGETADGTKMNFLADEELMLFQAGDMMSMYTPGFEGAALSGIDAAEHVLDMLCKMSKDVS